MKALTNLKLCALALVLTAGMTSCLKTSDPDFGVWADVDYLEQSYTGDPAKFVPVVRIVGNAPIASATATFEGMPGTFRTIPNSNNYYMELDFMYPVNTVKTGICAISATSAEEEPRTASGQLVLKVTKTLGAFEVEGELEYDDQTRVVTATWSKSENAEGYALMYQGGDSNTFLSLGDLRPTEKDGKLKGSITIPSTISGTIQIAVAAVCGNVCLMNGERTVAVGTN